MPVVVDQEYLASAYAEWGQNVYGYFRRRGLDGPSAEDLMSVVFLEAWRSRSRAFTIEGSISPWLLGIAANVLRTRMRTVRRYRAALERFHSMSAGDPLVVPDHADDVVARCDSGQDRARLDAAINRLTVKDREVVLLCLADGLSPVQTASVLGIPEGTVKSRLAHARSRLRALLSSGEVFSETDPGRISGHSPIVRTPRTPTPEATS